jgi:hypothetical protein
VGGVIFDSTFRSVDFPAPFFPIMPMLSPALTLKLIFFNAQNTSDYFFEKKLSGFISLLRKDSYGNCS